MNQCLHVHQLTIGHSQQHSVVKNINLTIETGEIWCILGANGSGKSTLLRTLAGILKPLSGTVLLNGNPLWKMSGKQKAKQIAFVAQHKSNPLEFTIEELFNLYKSGDHGFFKSKIASTEHKQTTRTPKNLLNEMGLDCDLQTAFHKLSGGQQQIVRLALAIIQDSQFLILDEPTASLDIAHAQIVATHIQRIAKQQKGVILSTHDPQLANQLNANLVLLKDGHILAQGPANVVLNDANLSKLYNTPVACIPTAHGLWIKPKH